MQRRNFLLGTSLLLTGFGAPARAALPPSAPRRLSLVRADNGERFSGPFRDDEGPDIGALGELAHFLRDRHVERMIAVDPELLDFLADVLGRVGASEATLLSGFRSPETNAKLAKTQFGVAERSHHVFGRAIDFFIARRLADAAETARKMARGGVGWYPGSRFIHLDTGPTRFWTLQGNGLRGLLGARATKHKNLALQQCQKDPARRQFCGRSLARTKAPTAG